MYADDIVIMIASKDINELIQKMESDIIKVNNWLQENKLQIPIS